MTGLINKDPSSAKRLVRSVWLFPALLTILLILATSFRINGSSIGGIYHQAFYGSMPDKNLLLNHAEGIRSDEWLVTTQLTIAQHAAGYPRINPNIDAGRDMTVIGDAPAKDWSTIFRPQNISFFILPFEYAFAFKWWFLLYMLILSCYFFTLRIFKGRRLFATLFSSAISCSPFIFWWYATGTLASLFYGFLIILLSIRIINDEPAIFLKNKSLIYSRSVYVFILAYLLTSFVLVLYPPFQIAVAISLAFFILGLLLNTYGPGRNLISRDAFKKYSVFVAGLTMAGALIFAFVHTRTGIISAVTHTVYPGNRPVQPEGSSGYEILSTFLQPQLQRGSAAAHYFTNQSEASNFLLFLPFLFIPGFIVLLTEYKKTRKVNWPLLSIQLCASLFLAYLFVPFLGPFYRFFLLNKVANVRLFIGLGFIGAIQLLLVARSIDKLSISRKKITILSTIYTTACIGVMVFVGRHIRMTYPLFIHNMPFISALAIFFGLIIFCFMSRLLTLGVSLLLIFTVGSVFHIHPLYRGLGPGYNGQVIQAIDQVSKPGDTWVSMDDLFYENFALMAGRDSLSGIKPYPDLAFWRQVEGSKDDYIYNRYAHVIFTEKLPGKLHLVGPDSFQVQLSCTPFILKHVKFVLSFHPVSLPCIQQIREVNYPATTFYIYKISPRGS